MELTSIIYELTKFNELQDGWDGHYGVPISRWSVQQSIKLISDLANDPRFQKIEVENEPISDGSVSISLTNCERLMTLNFRQPDHITCFRVGEAGNIIEDDILISIFNNLEERLLWLNGN